MLNQNYHKFGLLLGILVAGLFFRCSTDDSNIPASRLSVTDELEMRIENEDKLVIPVDKVEKVWEYLMERLIKNKAYLKSLDPELDSYWYDERFTDIYFDTPDLTFLRQQSGIRYRKRINLTNPDHRKSGRELIQVKLNNIDDNEFNRGEIKFKVEPPGKLKSRDDIHPVLGFIRPTKRDDFKRLMKQMNIDPYSLKPILSNQQRRRSLYISRNGEQFISIRLDECSSEMMWVNWRHFELEPELNEKPYTDAGPEFKAYMENINQQIIDDILDKFPFLERDLTPKYNKAFHFFESKIPLLKFWIHYGFI